MAKLVATYAAGMFCVFTEQRTGMRQRAAIDIGDSTPTPEEMAALAGQLSDRWNWLNAIEPSPKANALPPTAKPLPERKREYRPRDNSDPKPTEREKMILAYMAENPGKWDARQIIAGLGFEVTEQRVGRWHHAFIAMIRAGQLVNEFSLSKEPGKGPVRKYVYSLPA